MYSTIICKVPYPENQRGKIVNSNTTQAGACCLKGRDREDLKKKFNVESPALYGDLKGLLKMFCVRFYS